MHESRPCCRRWLKLGALWGCWVIGLVVGSARSAPADCAHPERPAFRIAADDRWEGGLGFGQDQSADLAAKIRPTAPAKPKPCSGPQCSGKSAPSPSSAAVPKVAVAAAAWAWLAASLRGDETRSARFSIADPTFPTAPDPSSIFHPPRRSR